jgi:hypothetical protein
MTTGVKRRMTLMVYRTNFASDDNVLEEQEKLGRGREVVVRRGESDERSVSRLFS